ncbi:MAG TPA: hypothetical protein VGU61_02995 [Noviherbaspirillum sp.]|jgi:hypothetical protein|uniref:hypothetical protein n=1 Tax=Noviherbaspirillum sp. TaxID=1926288 RepID=UPI002DDCC077|nr:hypothetical protein [Noviherbaspirillum sp.]HEV2609212.1 hypothetical protein [Noviherbaspirillum sp.]
MTIANGIAAVIGAAIIWVGLQWFKRFHLRKMIVRYRLRAIAGGYGIAFDQALNAHQARCAAQKKRVRAWEMPGILAEARAVSGMRPAAGSEPKVRAYVENVSVQYGKRSQG